MGGCLILLLLLEEAFKFLSLLIKSQVPKLSSEVAQGIKNVYFFLFISFSYVEPQFFFFFFLKKKNFSFENGERNWCF